MLFQKEAHIKKTILVILTAVIIATPCLAQGIEPEGIFSIEGTRWGYCLIELGTNPPWVLPLCSSLGFYRSRVYECTMEGDDCVDYDFFSYVDLLVVSIVTNFDYDEYGGWHIYLGIMQPIGFGMWTFFGYTALIKSPGFFFFKIGIMFKIEDNWTPPEVE